VDGPVCSPYRIAAERRETMLGVFVEFQYGDDFDGARIAEIAHGARATFEGMQGLHQKAFTIDEANRRATNLYVWESEEDARAFFADERVEHIAGLYGVRPTLRFVEIPELVVN
jgi:heme-degrading monooxygenase HmoA